MGYTCTHNPEAIHYYLNVHASSFTTTTESTIQEVKPLFKSRVFLHPTKQIRGNQLRNSKRVGLLSSQNLFLKGRYVKRKDARNIFLMAGKILKKRSSTLS